MRLDGLRVSFAAAAEALYGVLARSTSLNCFTNLGVWSAFLCFMGEVLGSPRLRFLVFGSIATRHAMAGSLNARAPGLS